MTKLYLDLDGVLADFEKGVKNVTGKYPGELPISYMWKQLAKHGDFYYSLDWMPDGQELWAFMKDYNPTILTGLPRGNWARGQKIRWCGDNLGYSVPVICCMASDKANFCEPGDILVDDRKKAKDPWEQAGGIFIHHTSAKNSIAMFKGLMNGNTENV